MGPSVPSTANHCNYTVHFAVYPFDTLPCLNSMHMEKKNLKMFGILGSWIPAVFKWTEVIKVFEVPELPAVGWPSFGPWLVSQGP